MESFMNNPELMTNAQKMMNNPDFMNQMQEMMKNPMVQQMMSNPEMLSNIMNQSGLSKPENNSAEVEITPNLQEKFSKDDIVITSNLSKEEYNSKIANIIMYDSKKERYIISFDDIKISVKEENIDFYQD